MPRLTRTELVTQINQLDVWLEQAADDDTEADEQQAIAAAWERQKAAGMRRDVPDDADADETPRAVQSDVLRAAGEPFSAVSLCVEQAQALADMLQLSTETNEPADGSITVVAGMLFNHMHDARKHLDALWVAMGGSSRRTTE